MNKHEILILINECQRCINEKRREYFQVTLLKADLVKTLPNESMILIYNARQQRISKRITELKHVQKELISRYRKELS